MNDRRIHSAWPAWATLAGLVLIFFGERVLSGFDTSRYVLDGMGALAIVFALGARMMEAGNVEDPAAAGVRKLLVACTAGVLAALVLYALIPLVFSGDEDKKIRGVLWIGWPIALACSAFPLAAIEISVVPVARAARYEERRVLRAFERGLALALVLSIAFIGSYLADRHELKVDLSFGKSAEASEPTKRLVRDLTTPVEVNLFFPKANEVAEELERYFDSLAGSGGGNLKTRMVDQALATELASKAGINENGYVDLVAEKTHEKIRVGTNIRNSRTQLREFDQSFAKALVKVSREKSVAYFTVGHQERSVSPSSDDARPGLRVLKEQLRANQYEVKSLGLAEGLGSEIPKDASVVFIMGPEKPFLREEIDALRRGVKSGVKLLIALEVEREGDPMDEVLAELGLKFDKHVLANDRAFVRVTHTDADRAFLHTNRYSSHASVTTMTRHSTKLATLFARTGSIDKLPAAPAKTRVDVVLTALDGTFADKDGDLAIDEGLEERKAYGLGAAVTRTSTAPGEGETRAFVIGDVDVFTDEYIRYHGNPYLLADIVYWLRDLKEPVLPNISEEDVKIVHKRDEDALWFYSTTVGVPAVVLGAGLLSVRRRRSRRP
jgi:hypothetical protein